jgi:hypothetical protein
MHAVPHPPNFNISCMHAPLGMLPCMYYRSKVQEMMMAPHMHVLHARGTFDECNLPLQKRSRVIAVLLSA